MVERRKCSARSSQNMMFVFPSIFDFRLVIHWIINLFTFVFILFAPMITKSQGTMPAALRTSYFSLTRYQKNYYFACILEVSVQYRNLRKVGAFYVRWQWRRFQLEGRVHPPVRSAGPSARQPVWRQLSVPCGGSITTSLVFSCVFSALYQWQSIKGSFWSER